MWGAVMYRIAGMIIVVSALSGQSLPDSVTTNAVDHPLSEETIPLSKKVGNVLASSTLEVREITKTGPIIWIRVAKGNLAGWLTLDDLNRRSRIAVRTYAESLRGVGVMVDRTATQGIDGADRRVIRLGGQNDGGLLGSFLSFGLIPALVLVFGLIGWAVLRRK